MATSHPLSNSDLDYIDLRQILGAIFEKKRLWFGISSLFFIFAMIYAFTKPTTYQATALLEIHHKQESSLGSIYHENYPNNPDSINEEPISLQIALIRSKFILGPVIQSLNLARNQSESQVIRDLLSHLVIIDLSNSSDDSTKKAGVLQISMTGTQPEKIMQIVNQIARITQKKDKERKALEAKKSLTFLYQQLPILQASLKKAQATLYAYRSSQGTVDIQLQKQYLLLHLSDIHKQLEDTRLKKIDLSQDYTRYHPFMIALTQKQQALEEQRNDILLQIKKLPATDPTAANLLSDVRARYHLYMVLLNKIHEQQVITAGIVSDVSILAFATYPDQSFRLKLPIIASASFALSLLLGCLTLFFWSMLTQRVLSTKFHQL